MAIMEKALVIFFSIVSILDIIDIIERQYDGYMPGTFFLINVFLRSLCYSSCVFLNLVHLISAFEYLVCF